MLPALKQILSRCHHALGWPGEICKRCGRRNVASFIVSDAAWLAVTGDAGTVWCVQCFDVEAQRLGVEYSFSWIGGTSWSEWRDFERRAAKEEGRAPREPSRRAAAGAQLILAGTEPRIP